jgi:hypothetical protein
MRQAVPYYRVSTARQGRSGLGIEAQRDAVTRFAEGEGITLLGKFVEVQTGKGSDALDRRPQLASRESRSSLATITGDFLQMPIRSCCTFMRRWPRRRGGSSASAPDRLWRPAERKAQCWATAAIPVRPQPWDGRFRSRPLTASRPASCRLSRQSNPQASLPWPGLQRR